jgi:hypothetical protein
MYILLEKQKYFAGGLKIPAFAGTTIVGLDSACAIPGICGRSGTKKGKYFALRAQE